MSRADEYERRMRALGYENSLAGMDDEDIEWELARMDRGGAESPAPQLGRTYRPPDRDFAERMFKMFARPFDPNWKMPDLDGPEFRQTRQPDMRPSEPGLFWPGGDDGQQAGSGGSMERGWGNTDYRYGRDGGQEQGLRTAGYGMGRDDKNNVIQYTSTGDGGGGDASSGKEVSASPGYGGPGDAGAGQAQADYAKAQQERFDKEYDNYRRFEEARGRKPRTPEEMRQVFTQFGTLDRKYFNTGFVLDLTKAYRAAGQHEIADAIEAEIKKNPNWQAEQHEYESIIKIAKKLDELHLIGKIPKAIKFLKKAPLYKDGALP